MAGADEFRTGDFSIPGPDADEVPECCGRCPFLSYKEFSASGEGDFYYHCSYHWSDRDPQTPPPCLQNRRETA